MTDDIADDTFRRIREHMSPALALSSKFAGRGAVEVAGSGCEIELSDGRTMLDFGSYAVNLLGRADPVVVAAVQAQLVKLSTATRSLGNPVAALAAECLVEYISSPGLHRVHFGTNGSDAVEVAIKLARIATRRSKILHVEGSFHGKTLGALAVTSNPRFREGLDGLLMGSAPLNPTDEFAVARAVVDGDVAGIIFEPIQGENGVVELDPSVLRQWAHDAHAAGAFVIADEIQVGLRRAGYRALSLELGLDIDALLVGKPLGGGVVPVSAMLCTDALYAPLIADPFRHSSTFGSHPLSMAAIPPALARIEEFAARIDVIAALMEDGLGAIQAAYPDVIREVRGRGLIWGIDFVTQEHAGEISFTLADLGLIVSPCLGHPESLRLLPPLVSSDDDVIRALDIVREAVSQAAKVIGKKG